MSEKLNRLFGNDPRPFEQIKDYKKDLSEYYNKVDKINRSIIEKDKDSIALYNILYKIRITIISYEKIDTTESVSARRKLTERFDKINSLYNDSINQKQNYKDELKELRQNFLNTVVGTSTNSVNDQFKFDLMNMNETEIMKKIEDILKNNNSINSKYNITKSNENSVIENLTSKINRPNAPSKSNSSNLSNIGILKNTKTTSNTDKHKVNFID